MRAFAVLQMVQGHTTDVLLANNYRDIANPFFALWFFMRGMTAPIFMFTAGTVFTYLFRLTKEPFKMNPRVTKGIKRFLLLISLGYLLRYPTSTIISFKPISQESWNTFFVVDVLQSIGFGILFLLILAYVAEKLKMNDYYIFGIGGALFFIAAPFFENINWLHYLPRFIAGYFYSGTGSLFPLFPWCGYVIIGGVLGSYLAKHPNVFKTKQFSLRIGTAGIILLTVFLICTLVNNYFNTESFFWLSSYNTILLRVGFVLILNCIVSFISLSIETIPRFLILVGRNTLLIYIVHLVILYGSAWNPGLSNLFEKSFTAWQTFATAITMILLMSLMVWIIHKFKIKNKELVT